MNGDRSKAAALLFVTAAFLAVAGSLLFLNIGEILAR